MLIWDSKSGGSLFNKYNFEPTAEMNPTGPSYEKTLKRGYFHKLGFGIRTGMDTNANSVICAKPSGRIIESHRYTPYLQDFPFKQKRVDDL